MAPPPPFPHQIAGARWLAARKRALLADDPGTAKTRQVIMAADDLALTRIGIVCPAVVRAVWEDQIAQYSTIKRPVHLITSRDVPDITDGVWICSYNLLLPFKEKVRASKSGLELIVFDESQYIRNPKAYMTKYAYGGKKDGQGGALVRFCDRTWLLSGTPAPNHPAELWPMLHALWPEILPCDRRNSKPLSYSSFIRRYCKTRQIGIGRQQITGGKNLRELREMIAPIMLRRRLTDVNKDMPKLATPSIPLRAGRVPGLEAAEPLLAELLDAMQKGDRRRVKKLEAETSAIRRVVGLHKAMLAADLVKEDLAEGTQKIVLACWHREVIDTLVEQLGKQKCVVIRGGTSNQGRLDAVHKFKHDEKTKVFILQIKAGGTGLDGLQYVCREGIFVEYDWTDDNNLQVIRRLFRTGQRWPVRWRYLSIKGSIDERITEAAARKAGVSAALFDAEDNDNLDFELTPEFVFA